MALRTVRVRVGERWYTVDVDDLSTSPVTVTVDGETFEVEVEGLPGARPGTRRPSQPRPAQPQAPRSRLPAPGVSDKVVRSPMPGRVVSVSVRPGESVSAGQEVCVVEAMKMEQSIRISRDGVVKAVHVQPLQQVNAEDPLVELE